MIHNPGFISRLPRLRGLPAQRRNAQDGCRQGRFAATSHFCLWAGAHAPCDVPHNLAGATCVVGGRVVQSVGDYGQIEPIGDDAFPPVLADDLLARSRQMSVKRRQIVISEGSPTSDVFYILGGKVQISLYSLHGRETILRDMGPGRIFGELAAIDNLPRSANVIALEDSQLAIMSAVDFRAFLATVPQAGFWMAQQLAARVRDLTEKAFELATFPVSSRLQSELLRQCVEIGVKDDRCVIARAPTHAEFAARIGTHREAVTRELGLLANEGLVAQSGRTLTVLSFSRLQAQLAKVIR
ncbi:MAG: hypothetical protein RL367_1963 [Pseudomonadota bacterium]